MEKILKKYTSIPDHLYVNRNADEQLKRIVNEMQRPGYVLVARQMGKTNLLFNAKRTLEGPNRLFVYVDLSNLFKYERECYRNIIDNILEPNEDLFQDIEDEIKVLREKKLPPHKEYSKCLRVVLRVFKGDVVIVLDEIDALKSAEYSDHIFAQIRSNYFSRTNFPVFERLTYILSGVIEPTELIKDRNKSPFNIGDKIYLEDFSFEEHKTFIQKSGLKINQDISNRIFYWTNGNPRLTFDICSLVESMIIEGNVVTVEKLNTLIKREYLTTFDISPIDHIRELVKTNKQVRRAVLNIHQNKNDQLSDEIKKRLYLFGIINSKFDEDIKIKNPIVKISLSQEWIKSIDKQTQDTFSYGIEKINQYEYLDAISALLDFIKNSNPTKLQLESSNYHLGFAFYKTRNLPSAIEYFSKEYSIELYKDTSKSFLGICKLDIGEKDIGVAILEEVVEKKTNDFAFRYAILNLARVAVINDKVRALKLYDDLLKSTYENEDNTTEDDLNQLRTLAHFGKVELFYEEGDIKQAIESINKALAFSNPSDSLHLKFSKFIFLEGKDENLKFEIIDSIIDGKLKFDTKNYHPISFLESNLFLYLSLSFDPQNTTRFEKLLDYSYSELFEKRISKFEIVLQASKNSLQSVQILEYILSKEKSIPGPDLIQIYRNLSFSLVSDNISFFKYFNKYEKLFLESSKVISKDIYMYANAIRKFSDSKNIEKAINLCHTIESKVKGIDDDDELRFESVIIYYWYSVLNFTSNNQKNAIEYADKTIQLIQDSKKERTSMIDEQGLKTLLVHMNQIKKSKDNKRPLKRPKKYGRNEKIKVQYLDGKIKENKFKKLEADLLAERCKII